MTYLQKLTLGFLVVGIMCIINFWTLDRAIAINFVYGCFALLILFAGSFLFKRGQ